LLRIRFSPSLFSAIAPFATSLNALPTSSFQVLNTNEMYEKCDRFFNEAALTKESRENFSQREVRRGGPAFALANKKTVFVTSLTVLELCCGGNSKVADERRIKLIGVIADEICDLLSSNRYVSTTLVVEEGGSILAEMCDTPLNTTFYLLC